MKSPCCSNWTAWSKRSCRALKRSGVSAGAGFGAGDLGPGAIFAAGLRGRDVGREPAGDVCAITDVARITMMNAVERRVRIEIPGREHKEVPPAGCSVRCTEKSTRKRRICNKELSEFGD